MANSLKGASLRLLLTHCFRSVTAWGDVASGPAANLLKPGQNPSFYLIICDIATT